MGWPNPSYTRWLGASTRAVVEDGLSFNVHRLVRPAGNLPGGSRSGLLEWSIDGERCASIRYRVSIDSDDAGELSLTFRVDGEPVNQTIWLEKQPCRFGGGRWYAVCPVTRESASKLYLPSGGRRFLSRHAYRLAYRTQNECAIGRASTRRHRIAARLKLGDPNMPIKPRGMRWATFDRALDRLARYDAIWSVAMCKKFGIGDW